MEREPKEVDAYKKAEKIEETKSRIKEGVSSYNVMGMCSVCGSVRINNQEDEWMTLEELIVKLNDCIGIEIKFYEMLQKKCSKCSDVPNISSINYCTKNINDIYIVTYFDCMHCRRNKFFYISHEGIIRFDTYIDRLFKRALDESYKFSHGFCQPCFTQWCKS